MIPPGYDERIRAGETVPIDSWRDRPRTRGCN